MVTACLKTKLDMAGAHEAGHGVAAVEGAAGSCAGTMGGELSPGAARGSSLRSMNTGGSFSGGIAPALLRIAIARGLSSVETWASSCRWRAFGAFQSASSRDEPPMRHHAGDTSCGTHACGKSARALSG